jgi:hypothetical protein
LKISRKLIWSKQKKPNVFKLLRKKLQNKIVLLKTAREIKNSNNQWDFAILKVGSNNIASNFAVIGLIKLSKKRHRSNRQIGLPSQSALKTKHQEHEWQW